jgi:hypothetical protein
LNFFEAQSTNIKNIQKIFIDLFTNLSKDLTEFKQILFVFLYFLKNLKNYNVNNNDTKKNEKNEKNTNIENKNEIATQTSVEDIFVNNNNNNNNFILNCDEIKRNKKYFLNKIEPTILINENNINNSNNSNSNNSNSLNNLNKKQVKMVCPAIEIISQYSSILTDLLKVYLLFFFKVFFMCCFNDNKKKL